MSKIYEKILPIIEQNLNENNLKLFLYWIIERYNIHLLKDIKKKSFPWTDKDYNADGDFIMKQLKDWKPQIVYVNGKNTLTPVQKDLSIIIRSTDAEFKSLMG